jgi:hypothetical protein
MSDTTKWEFISTALSQLKDRLQFNIELTELIEIANSFDSFLKEKYPGHSPKWLENRTMIEEDFEWHMSHDLYFALHNVQHIAEGIELCTACYAHGSKPRLSCKECGFAEAFGACPDNESVFMKFELLLDRVIDIYGRR